MHQWRQTLNITNYSFYECKICGIGKRWSYYPKAEIWYIYPTGGRPGIKQTTYFGDPPSCNEIIMKQILE